MKLEEIFKRMSTGDLQAHSELGSRDENKQSRHFGTRFRKMKTVTGIDARAMLFKDVVIPFNPFTGVADNVYGPKTPFRPILLVSQVITGLKEVMAENEEMKKFWEEELGIEFTDGPATMDEYYAFKEHGFIKPRVMTYYTVTLNFGGLYGYPDFKVRYSVDPSALNAEGNYDFETAPIWHRGAVFFKSMLKMEADEKRKQLESSGANKDTIQDTIRAIFSKSPVGFVSPTNLVPFLLFPHGELPKKLDPSKPKEIEQYIHYYSYTDKFVVPLNDILKKNSLDEDMDFIDLTIKTPTTQDTKKDGTVFTDKDANELYATMQVTVTDGRYALHNGKLDIDGKVYKTDDIFSPVIETAKAYFEYSQEQETIEGGDTFEKAMATSNRFRPIDSAMGNFLNACNDIFNRDFATSKYFTDSIKESNSKFLIAMNPDNSLVLADKDEDELEEAEAASKANVSDIISLDKELNGAEFNESEMAFLDDDAAVDVSADDKASK